MIVRNYGFVPSILKKYNIEILSDDEIRNIILTDMALGYYDYE